MSEERNHKKIVRQDHKKIVRQDIGAKMSEETATKRL